MAIWKKKQNFKDLIKLIKDLIYLWRNVIILFEVQKKYRKKKCKNCKDKKRRIMLLSKCIMFCCKKKQNLSKCKKLVD